jgi:NADP-dependent 3-hydroxy acid dehydrogenase YdfG
MKNALILITGASSGIGEGCARKFAAQGSNLLLNGRNKAKLESLKAALEKQHGSRYFSCLSMSETGRRPLRLVFPPARLASHRRAHQQRRPGVGVDKEHEAQPEEWDVMIDTNIKDY